MISKQQIKYIRSLHKKKFRDQNRQFIIEGPKMIKEAMEYAPHSISHVFGLSEMEHLFAEQVAFESISQKELNQISVLRQPQKILAICNYLPPKSLDPEFYIALDTIQDPGNLGTILRLASWFGVQQIIASKETVDCYNTKVVQASMGAIFNVQIEYVDLKEALQNVNLPIYGSLLNGENIYQSQKAKKGILLMGNEGKGIHSDLLPLITHPVTIPKFGYGESLNVAMATSIFLSEFSRSS
ncbi:RNA methyltransferase [Brumimicrobium salinarum]|uniref:RNA methyltransferase n=1 Tax=Brumimicrobium salinarum TaxID=2058658 RepID=A0A2I0R2V2_9FLAO|nr:RNA methyltransferase [Brumimicrobium salinarum]PKR80912.1 RNA methyltransferase [Brumimicrobium salinarum]